MPGCPQCGKGWPETYARCPDDGAALTAGVSRGASSHGSAAADVAHGYDEDLPPGSTAGEYRIEKKIGEGGMGSVYGAKHPLIGKRAAIKVIRRELSGNPEAVDRFVLEAQSVNQIGHPNIVDVFGFGQLPDGRSFFVMEWLEGESLRERMQRPLQFPDALEMLESIAKALQAAHEAGVVHRDLKPDNVFLQSRKGEKPTVKLLDFGLAKLTGQGDGRMGRTRPRVVMGPPLYLSPEQAKGQKIDAATDVYSLGAMAYEMLSGSVPFKADSAVEIMAMHISAPATSLAAAASWVPPEIDQLVLQMLEKNPARRPTTAEVRERIGMLRNRASTSALAVAVNPSTHVTPYTPAPVYGTPPPGSHTPPPMHHTPMHQTPMHPTPAPMTGMQPAMQSSMAYEAPAKKSKLPLIIGAVVLLGGAIGAAAFFAGGKGDESKPVAAVDPQPVPPQPDNHAVGSGSGSAGVAVPVDPKPVDPKPVDPTPADTKPVDPQPTDPKPADPKPADPKPADPRPADPRPRPTARTGRVVVSFNGPPRAMIFVDGVAQGRESGGRVTLELPPGDHTIRVQAKGFKPGVANIRVDAGGSRDVKLTLEKRSSANSVHNPFD